MEPGTLIKNVVYNPISGVCSFLASTDGGKDWYRKTSDERPKTREVSHAESA